MSVKFQELGDDHTEFIQQQKIFFVGTAAADGRVNVSPKGKDALRVLGKNRVAWLNLTGSGNETAAHLIESDRMTLMFCAFEGDPLILRLYGHAKIFHPRDAEWPGLVSLFPTIPGARQIIDLEIDLVQTSCGNGVPNFDFKEERDILTNWAERKGAQGLSEYWENRNQTSIDGKPTRILADSDAEIAAATPAHGA